MKNHNERSFFLASRHGRLPAVILALALAGCGKSPERPAPHQAPPKPQVMTKALAGDVQKAVFSYSSKPSADFQNGNGVKVKRHVIHT